MLRGSGVAFRMAWKLVGCSDAGRLCTAPPPHPCGQHPIYGSYILLFCGYCLACHSAPFALLSLWACGVYFRRRAALEAEVLAGAFGAQYDAYRARTPRLFVPWVA
jgi:protein-S-isoprenylcysteine O-methyltransferase Ste14